MLNYHQWVFILLLFPFSLSAQADWVLGKEGNGIKVYTKVIEGSSFKAARAITEVDASLHTIAAVFIDVEAYDQLFPDTQDPVLLERPNDKKQIHYMITKAPWPVSDRDGIFQYLYSYSSAEKTLWVELTALPNYQPDNEDIVRIQTCDGKFRIQDLGNGRSKITYEFHAEPGGSIPTWLANSSVTSQPYDFMTNLKKRVLLDKYRSARVSFIP